MSVDPIAVLDHIYAVYSELQSRAEQVKKRKKTFCCCEIVVMT